MTEDLAFPSQAGRIFAGRYRTAVAACGNVGPGQ